MLLSIDCGSLNALAIISKHGSLLDIVIITGFDSLPFFASIRVNGSLNALAIITSMTRYRDVLLFVSRTRYNNVLLF